MEAVAAPRNGSARHAADRDPDHRVHWGVLGPVEGLQNGVLLPLGSTRQRAILALLLAHAGGSVAMSTLVDTLWPTNPPKHAVNVIHRNIGSLRRIAEPGLPRRAQGSWLRSSANGYRVDVPPENLDVLAFRRGYQRARQVTDPFTRLDAVCAALDIWRGWVAEDLPTELRSDPIFESLSREHAVVALEAGDQALQLGQASRVIPALTLAGQGRPTDELLHAALIRCLASAGQRAEALTIFRNLRIQLEQDLGVSPGPALTQAHLDVLRDNLEVEAAARRLPTPAQLPADTDSFSGRAGELQTLLGRVRDTPESSARVLITGTAGVGKTRLAVRLAHRLASQFRAGQLFVDLRGFDPSREPLGPHHVLGRFLEALDVPANRIPALLDDRAALFRSRTSQRNLVVLLDNARDTAQVTPLLPGEGCLVIVTSRRQLRGLANHGFDSLALSGFSFEEAREFFSRRLPGPGRIDEGGLTQIFDFCGGLPLTLGLVAARAAYMPRASLAEIATSLREAGTALDAFVDSGDPRADPRDVISWSYDAVSGGAARMLRLLSRHPGPRISVPHASELAALTESQSRALMEELYESSLIWEAEPGWYQMHDLVAVYAREQEASAADGEGMSAEGRLYRGRAAQAVRAAINQTPPRTPPEPLDPSVGGGSSDPTSEEDADAWFLAETDVLVALVHQADQAGRYQAELRQLAWALFGHLDRAGRWQDFLSTQRAALQAAQGTSPVVLVAALRGVGRAESHLGLLQEAREHVEAALAALPTVLADPFLRSETHRQLSYIFELSGDYASALRSAQDALTHVGDSEIDPRRGYTVNAVGWYEAHLGRWKDAESHALLAVELLADGRAPYGLAEAWSTLGYVLLNTDRSRAAVRCFVRELALHRRLGYRYGEALACQYLAEALTRAGHPGLARPLLVEAVTLLTELGHQRATNAREDLAALDHQLTKTNATNAT